MNWNGIASLLVACVEILLLINLLIFAEKNKINKIAFVMISLLAGYQALEFLMCNVGYQNPFFPFLAFVVISFLPPLNLMLTLSLDKQNHFKKIWLIFLPAIGFIIYYVFVIPKFAVTSCTFLYATYNYPLGDLYGFFYYLPILISIIILIRLILKSDEKKQSLIAKVLLLGSIFISLPTLIGFTLIVFNNYFLISAIESIMCKFAFVYVICLSFVCLYNTPKKQ